MYLLSRQEPGAGTITKHSVSKDPEKTTGRRFLLCSGCLNRITRNDVQINVNGSHKHVFVNPQGLVFELGCFAWAVNCVGTGPSTSEFSWFSGYQWQITVCLQCLKHLGWKYEAPDKNGFYGLILDRLVEESGNN